MILNITLDDKFVPFLQGLFEEASPGESLWRVLRFMPDQTFAVQADNMEYIDREYFASEKFKNDLQVANCVIFHSLFLSREQKLLVLSRIPENMPIVWRGWGFDYYGILEAKGLRLLLPETSSLIESLGESKQVVVKQFPGKKLISLFSKAVKLLKKPGLSKRVFDKQFPSKLLITIFPKMAEKSVNDKFIARVNFFSCCVPDDFEALQRALPGFKAQFLPLNYYSTEDVFLRGDSLQELSGHDILLGNSADPTNNHIEALRVLSKIGMQGRKVVVPLSYGVTDIRYKEKLLKDGSELLGESFIPLTSFMSLPEYNQLVSGCGNIIMNHIRQQAMGNISAGLLRGGKVFLRPENPIYKFYTRMGVKLFPFSDDLTIADLNTPLNKDDARQNKEIMLRIWSREQGIKNVKAISLLCNRRDQETFKL